MFAYLPNIQIMAILIEDIVETILEQAHYIDSRILQNCSLVCRSFLLLSRKRLFREVNIFITPDLPGRGTTYGQQAASRLQFIASNDYVASIIRHICFHYSDQQNTDSPVTWAAATAALSNLYPKLESIRHISVHSSLLADWFRLNGRLTQTIIRLYARPTIDCVELFYVGLSFADLMSFLRVRKLVLVGVYLIDDANLPITLPEECKGFSALTNLSVTLRNFASAEPIYLLAQAARRSLRSLEWMASPHHSE
jgi:hypothetical protein